MIDKEANQGKICIHNWRTKHQSTIWTNKIVLPNARTNMKQSFNKQSPFTNPLPPQDKVAQGRMKAMTLGSFVNTFFGC